MMASSAQRIEHDAINRRKSDDICGLTDEIILQSPQIFATKIRLHTMSSSVVPQIHPEFGDNLPVSLEGNGGQTNLSQMLVSHLLEKCTLTL